MLKYEIIQLFTINFIYIQIFSRFSFADLIIINIYIDKFIGINMGIKED